MPGRWFWLILSGGCLSLVLLGCDPIVVTPVASPGAQVVTATPRPDPATATVTPTSTATPTPSLAATPPLSASTTPTASLSLTPAPTDPASPTPEAALRQLTKGGCCTQPFFSADSRQVLFLDKPGPDAPAGIYGVELGRPQASPELVHATIGFRNTDRTIVGVIEGDLVRLTNEVTGASWTIDSGGNPLRFSPDSQRILWVATDREGPYDQRQSDVWLADLAGTNRRRLFTIFGGQSATWFPDSQRLLMIGRDQPWVEELTLFIYAVDSGQRTDLFSHKRLRGSDLSANGRWVAYLIAFADEPADNGLWLINTADAGRHKAELPNFGAFRWRSDDTLLFIPFRAGPDESMQLWTIAAATGQSQPLTDPASLPFTISNGDWDVSPDGRQVVFVSSTDQNIWLITLPAPG